MAPGALLCHEIALPSADDDGKLKVYSRGITSVWVSFIENCSPLMPFVVACTHFEIKSESLTTNKRAREPSTRKKKSFFVIGYFLPLTAGGLISVRRFKGVHEIIPFCEFRRI